MTSTCRHCASGYTQVKDESDDEDDDATLIYGAPDEPDEDEDFDFGGGGGGFSGGAGAGPSSLAV